MNRASSPRPALTDDLSFVIARARSVSSSATNRRLAQFDLKVRSYSVLALACEDSQLTQRETASFLWLDPSQIVAIIDDLESRGLVVREASTRDRRRKVLRGTESGHALYARAREAAALSEADTFAHLAPAEREQLRNLLYRVAFPVHGEAHTLP